MRRAWAVGVVGAGLAAVATVAGGQDKPLKKVVFAVTTKDISVGHAAHSSLPQGLGYWKEEGLDVTVTSVEGSAAGLQQLGSGNIDVVSLGPEEIVIGREKGVKIRGFYVQARETIYRVVVPAESPLQKLADLKGRTIGVPSLASGSLPFAKALLASVGVDPDQEVKFLAVGVGAPGRLALQQKQVEALALWDTLQASLENSGMRVRRAFSAQDIEVAFEGRVGGEVHARLDHRLAQALRAQSGFDGIEDLVVGHGQTLDVGAAEEGEIDHRPVGYTSPVPHREPA